MAKVYKRKSVEDRFWSKVDIKGLLDCWEWTAKSIRGHGYGFICINQKKISAHRLSYEMAYGKIPDDLLVLHSCNNKKCVNPAHLRVGTNQDNADDRINKRRKTKTRPRPKLRITVKQYNRAKLLINDFINNNAWKQISQN
ncbi:MAG: hypothetical protein QG588_786 [Candidatus Poribacteria bacterium]|nr:hypothetical protein [Candidatus Poribacteria bacterium]